MSRLIDGYRFACLALSATLATPGVASAGPGAWTSGGPYGGAWALAVDPTNSATVYAGTGREVFKSTDSGATWAPAATGLPVTGVNALAIDASAPATIYAATKRGVFKSTDSGATWAAAMKSLDEGLNPTTLAIAPSAPANLYLGTPGSGAYKSTNAGGSWTPVGSGLGCSSIAALAVHPAAATTVFAGCNTLLSEFGGVYKSTDGGSSWAPASAGLTDPDVEALAIDPANPATLYAGTIGGGVFKSTDSGGTWAPAAAGLTDLDTLQLAVNPSSPATVYAGSGGGGVYKTTDAGASWTVANAGLTNLAVRSLAISPSASATVYAATSGGVFRSTDSAGSWTEADTGITGHTVGALAIATSAPATIYAGTTNDSCWSCSRFVASRFADAEVFKSTDAGGSWAALASPGLPSAQSISALAVDPATPSTLYAGVYPGGVFKTTDAGASWGPGSISGERIEAFAIHPSAPATVYAAGWFGVWKSTDAGGTWSQTSSPPFVYALAQDPSTPATLYAGGAGVYKSTDAGDSWAQMSLSEDVWSLAIDPSTPSTLYASSIGVYRSTDAGGTWSSAGLSGVVGGWYAIPSLVVAPDGTVYAGRGMWSGGRIYRSTNAGASWVAVNEGLVDPNVAALALDPSGTTLYAGLDGGSVWQATAPPAFVKGDLNGDSQPDLVFRSTVAGAQNKAWFMDGVTRTAEAAVSPDAASADWSIRGVDDFDADGRNDLVFRNQLTGQVEFWLMNGTTRLGAPVPLTGGPVLDPGWELAATADFNHDVLPDIVWRNATSQKIVIWIMYGTGKTPRNIIPTPAQAVDGNWAIVAALDYDGDGNTDFLWYNSTSGKIVTWYMDASVVRTSGQFTSPANAGDANWKVVASGDYSREYVPGTPPLGSPDIVWRNETSGNQVVWHMDFASTRVHGEFTSPAANTPALDWTIVGPR